RPPCGNASQSDRPGRNKVAGGTVGKAASALRLSSTGLFQMAHPENTMYALSIDRVTKRYDSIVAVSQLSLVVRQGSVFGLLGPNGAGKTTTLRMVMKILIPDEGSVQVLGQPLSERTQDVIGYLPEERGLYPRMRVRDVLIFLSALKGLSQAEASRRSGEWLERLGLSPWSHMNVLALSNGMRQK